MRRDTATKSSEALADVAAGVPALLEQIQADLLAAATERREANTQDVTTLEEAVAATAEGFARIPWTSVARDRRRDGAAGPGHHGAVPTPT